MKVVLFFLREHVRTSDTFEYMMYGKYEEGGLIFVSDTAIEGFYTVPDAEYSRHVLTHGRGWNSAKVADDFLLLSLDEEEKRRLKATCEACATVKKPFNMRDVLLMYVPFVDLKELSIAEAPTLNNTQAIILLFRECLNADNPLRKSVGVLHSRQTLLEAVYDRVAPHALPVLWSNLVGQLRDKGADTGNSGREVKAVKPAKAV